MRRAITFIISLLCGLIMAFANPGVANSQGPAVVVRAVLFYSPTCPHCHYVLTDTLPDLLTEYGDQLEVIGIDISQEGGHELYEAAIERFAIPDYRLGVPALIVGETVLVGSLEIPAEFPGLIDSYLAQGGMGWPDIPGLSEVLAEAVPAVTVTAPEAELIEAPPELLPVVTDATPIETRPAWMDAVARDPVGNTLSIIVLIGMLGAIVWVPTLSRRSQPLFGESWAWAIPVLCAIGVGIATYLSYVETAQVPAVCGPVGDCNTVQQSSYARLFGVIPIGVLGFLGYAVIITAWVGARFARGRVATLAGVCLFGLASFGTLFSIYLTFLEPFVIGATCIWCLSSAVVMTLILILSAKALPAVKVK